LALLGAVVLGVQVALAALSYSDLEELGGGTLETTLDVKVNSLRAHILRPEAHEIIFAFLQAQAPIGVGDEARAELGPFETG
jgi:hypothetical protein